MKGPPGSIVELLRPVLDTYMDSSVGLTGCNAAGLARESCEYDVIIVGAEKPAPTTIKVGDKYMDLFFLIEADATKPSSPEIAASMASVKPVRDSALVLSSCTSAAQESSELNAQRSAENRLTASIKALGRAEDSASKDQPRDADFWLVAAGYEFAFAWLYTAGQVPAPSHLLSQLRQLSRGQPGMYEAFSKAAGLENASRPRCDSRIDSLGVIYDLKEAEVADPEAMAPSSLRTSYDLLRLKSESMLAASQPADCYCFLGLEVITRLPEVLRDWREMRENAGVVSSLSGGEHRLVSDTVVKALGIERSDEAVRDGLRRLQGQVSALTRKT